MAGWMLYIEALSAIQCGTGEAEGAIDMPVAREKATGWPVLPGSTLKGVLRDAAENSDAIGERDVEKLFGFVKDDNTSSSGSVWVPDARLLCFPVASLAGTFAWVTSPLALDRWQQDQRNSGLSPAVPPPTEVLVNRVQLARTDTLDINGKVYLGDLDLDVEAGETAPALADEIARQVFPGDSNERWRERFVERFAILNDEIFTHLTLLATDVTARIRLEDKSKTVAEGGLWYEESVVAQSIFSAPVIVEPRRTGQMPDYQTWLNAVTDSPLQIGGNASVGRGLVSMRLSDGTTDATS